MTDEINPRLLAWWLKRKENQRKLDECDRPHLFTAYSESLDGGEAWAICERCGGRIKGSEAVWYTRGVEDARKK